MDLSKDQTVVRLQILLQGNLVENMEQIEAAAQDAVGALSKLDGTFNSVTFDRNIRLVTVPKTIPLYSWMLDSEPALFVQNALKGDIRLVLIAAFAGSPIGYPLLALRRAIQTKYNSEATRIDPGDLLAMIHGFDDQVDQVVENLGMDVSNIAKDDQLRPLIEKMFPQVEEDAPDFKRNNIDWTASTNIIPIPSGGGGGGKGGGVRGGGGGNGDGIPEGPKEPKELEEPKEPKDSEPNEDSNSFMFVIILLLLCVAAFALIKGNGR